VRKGFSRFFCSTHPLISLLVIYSPILCIMKASLSHLFCILFVISIDSSHGTPPTSNQILTRAAIQSPKIKAGRDTCPLKCANGTRCVRDDVYLKAYPYDPVTGQHYFANETSRKGWVCACPPGKTGIRCSRSFDSCHTAQDDSGKGTLGC
jgi:hypothetical protein